MFRLNIFLVLIVPFLFFGQSYSSENWDLDNIVSGKEKRLLHFTPSNKSYPKVKIEDPSGVATLLLLYSHLMQDPFEMIYSSDKSYTEIKGQKLDLYAKYQKTILSSLKSSADYFQNKVKELEETARQAGDSTDSGILLEIKEFLKQNEKRLIEIYESLAELTELPTVDQLNRTLGLYLHELSRSQRFKTELLSKSSEVTAGYWPLSDNYESPNPIAKVVMSRPLFLTDRPLALRKRGRLDILHRFSEGQNSGIQGKEGNPHN